MLRRLLCCVFALTSLCLVTTVSAQSYIYDAGSPAYGVNIPVENGFINVTNGNLHMEFPLAQHQQRGDLKLNERLVYDSHFWKIGHYSNYYWWPDNVPRNQYLAAGWRFESGADTGAFDYTYGNYNQYECSGYPDQGAYSVQSYQMGFQWTDPTGTVHPFSGTYYISQYNCPDNPSPNPETQTGTATDASGYSITVSGDDQSGPSSISIRDNNGTQVYPQIADRYGNYWSTDSSGNLVDDRGQTPVQVSYSGNQIYYDVLRQGGGRARYTVTTVQVTPHTQFGQQAVAEYPNGNNAVTLNAVQSIQLPDGSSYQFGYENTFGMITSVTLPTGGQLTYGWSNYTDSYKNVNRWLTSRQAGSDPQSTFTPAVVSTCASNQQNCHEKVTVHEPGGDETVYDMQLNLGAWNVNTQRFSGSASNGGTLVSSTDTVYNNLPTCGASCYSAGFITSQTVTTTLADTGLKRSDAYEYANNALGLVSAKKTYDFYTGSLPSQPMQQTQYTYAYDGVPNDLKRLAQTDGAGNYISYTDYSYTNSAQPTSGLPNHDLSQSLGVYLQSTRQWINTDGSSLATTLAVDDAGMVLSSAVSNGSANLGTTTYTPDTTDTFVANTALPTPSSGVAMSSGTSQDTSTGVLSSTTDVNNQITTYQNYDSMNRVNEIDYPDGGQTTFSRAPTQVFVTTKQSGSINATDATQFDEFGRASRTAKATGQSDTPWYQTDTCYNSNGQVEYASLPYAGIGWNQAKSCSGNHYTYDTLGRPQTITLPDGRNSPDPTIQYFYRGRATQVTDFNGIQKITQIDGLGRTVAVCEVTSQTLGNPSPSSCGLDISATGFLTTYSYDDVNHKTTVAQGTQTRVFQTDSLGRTVYSSETERGTTTYAYSYSNSGLTTTRTRPKANSGSTGNTSTTTSYDLLGRVTRVLYDDKVTPGKAFNYDQANAYGRSDLQSLSNTKGHLTLTQSYTGLTNEVFGYDPMGRINYTWQCVPGACTANSRYISRKYLYDYAGNRTSDQFLFPGDTTWESVDKTYTVAGELDSMSATGPTFSGSSKNSGALLSNMQQSVVGPTKWLYGNGLTGKASHYTNGTVNEFDTCVGNSYTNCAHSSRADRKGDHITFYADTVVNPGFSSSFAYDDLNRLSGVSYGNAGVAFNISYDRYGNRLSQNYTQGSGMNVTYSPNTSNNQYSSMYSYDNAGNLINDGLHQYQYDAEGNVISIDNGATTYSYDALNQRVQVQGAGASLYAFDADGRRSMSLHFSGTTPILDSTNVFWGDRLLATYDANQVYFQHIDPLGTVRVTTGPTGSTVGTFGSMPYGDRFQASGSDIDMQHFAELDRDANSDTHNATFRQYTSNQGRWMSPDPYDGSYDLSNPQSLNRYSYVNNNPFSGTDPSGLDGGGGTSITGSIGGCTGAVLQEGANPISDIGCALEIGKLLSDIFSRPSFKGSLTPRPGVQGGSTSDPWNESLGYPKGGPQLGGGWGVAGALGLPTDQGCEFGGCGFAGPGTELHHVFPQQFKDWFTERGIDIEEYKITLGRAAHRLKPNGLHTRAGGDWNGKWSEWMKEHPGATREQILRQGRNMMDVFGVIGSDLLSDFTIMVNPCMTSRVSYCNNGG